MHRPAPATTRLSDTNSNKKACISARQTQQPASKRSNETQPARKSVSKAKPPSQQQDAAIKTASAYSNVPNTTRTPKSVSVDEPEPVSTDDGARKEFDSAGYDSELVSLIQNGIIQRTPSVNWSDVSGLSDAKNLLTEAVVLPMEYPELFKVSLALKVLIYPTFLST